jgi:hypothetical protein
MFARKGRHFGAALTLERLTGMQDEVEPIDTLVFSFMKLFEVGEPLREESVVKWKAFHVIKSDRLKEVADLAIKEGWILEDSAGIWITHEGRNKRDG